MNVQIEIEVPEELKAAFEEVGPQHEYGERLDARMRVIAQSEAERAYWEQQVPRRTIGSPLATALIGYDEEGNRWASPMKGGQSPVQVPWGLMTGVYSAGNFESAYGVTVHGASTIYARDADQIVRLANELIDTQRNRYIELAERSARLDVARARKVQMDRADRMRRDSVDAFKRANTCPQCGGDDQVVSTRTIHNGASSSAENGPSIRSCIDCWGRAHAEWLAGLSKRRARR